MPSELFLPFFPKVLNTHCWSASCPIHMVISKQEYLAVNRKWEQQRGDLCFPVFEAGHGLFHMHSRKSSSEEQTSQNKTVLLSTPRRFAVFQPPAETFSSPFLVMAPGSDRFLSWGNFKYWDIAWDWYFILQTGHLQLKFPAN